MDELCLCVTCCRSHCFSVENERSFVVLSLTCITAGWQVKSICISIIVITKTMRTGDWIAYCIRKQFHTPSFNLNHWGFYIMAWLLSTWPSDIMLFSTDSSFFCQRKPLTTLTLLSISSHLLLETVQALVQHSDQSSGIGARDDCVCWYLRLIGLAWLL